MVYTKRDCLNHRLQRQANVRYVVIAGSGWNMDQARRNLSSSPMNLVGGAKENVVADRISCVERK